MKRTDKMRYLVMGITGILLVMLCAGLWGVSDAAGADRDERNFPVYISEILANNTRYPNEYGQCCDYIELYNSADYAIDLGGFQLSDGSKQKRYQFPAGSVLAPGGCILVYSGGQGENSRYASFGLSRSGGETVMFLTSKGVVIEKVTTVETPENQAMIPGPEGTWILSDPTPGVSNDAPDVTGSHITPLRISEVMTAGSGDPEKLGNSFDWVELHNTSGEALDISGFVLSDDLESDAYRFPQGTVIPGEGYLVVSCTDEMEGSQIAPFALSRQGGEALVLKTSDGRIADMMDTLPVSGSQSMALMEAGTFTITDQITPGFANTVEGRQQYLGRRDWGNKTLVITEIMASNQTAALCGCGEFCDWVELKNNTDAPMDLAGWHLSDDPDDPEKWTFPKTVLEPGACTLVPCSGSHTGFSLAAAGETLILTAPGGAVSHVVTYRGAQTDRSVCVDPDTGEQTVTAMFTPGFSNDAQGWEAFSGSLMPRGPLAIWEVMTENSSFLPQARGKCYDWVELRNISPEPVALSDYSLTDSTGHPDLTVLPDKVLAPGEMMVVILSGDARLGNAAYFHGDFSLNGTEDSLYLYRRDGTLVDFVFAYGIPEGSSLGRTEASGGFRVMEPTPMRENETANMGGDGL